jgi:hypothetical protein
MGQLLDGRSRNLRHIIRREPSVLDAFTLRAKLPLSASIFLQVVGNLGRLSY